MLIVFRSKAAADVLMLSRHAAPVLHAAGKLLNQDTDAPERGVFTVAQLAGAIAGIERASAQGDASQAPMQDDEPIPAMEQAVSLRQRAYPVLDMLRQAQAKGVDVMWEPA